MLYTKSAVMFIFFFLGGGMEISYYFRLCKSEKIEKIEKSICTSDK